MSIRPEDFAPARLVCLGRLLADRYRDRHEIEILIFASRRAAEEWSVGNEGDYESGKRPHLSRAAAERDLRARLHRQPNGEEFVVLNPLDASLRSRLQLHPSSPQNCRHNVDHRCLLVVGDLAFPPTGVQVNGHANVTFNVRTTKQGAVKVLRVSSADAPVEVVAAAKRHLEAWRFETAPRESSFDVTYCFEQDPSMPRGLRTIEFQLPERVVIRQP